MSAPTAPSHGSAPDAHWPEGSREAQGPQWPQWMEDARLDDSLAANAYEETPPAYRAAIKTGLALAHMHFGSSTGQGRETRNDERLGFWREHEHRAAAWTVIAFPPSYAAAARLAAACISPILADVPLLGAVCVGGTPHPSALVSLELSGVENIFVLDAPGLHALLEQCGPGPGRLLLLHAGELAQTVGFARSLGLPCWQEDQPPTLLLPPAEKEEMPGTSAEAQVFDLEALAFAQAGARFIQNAAPPQTMGMAPSRPDAHYVLSGPAQHAARCREKSAPSSPPLLTLTPGCEGFWLHPGLGPDFFRVHSLAFGLL